MTPRRFFLLAATGMVTGCAAFPQLVRHQDPLSADEHKQLAQTYEAQGQTADALKQYEQALKQDKEDVLTLMKLGNAAFEAKEWKSAEKYFRRVIRQDPNHPGAKNNLAMTYVEENKNLKKAERLVHEAFQNPGSLKPYILETLSQIQVRTGRVEEARQSLMQAEAAAPASDKALLERLAQAKRNLPR